MEPKLATVTGTSTASSDAQTSVAGTQFNPRPTGLQIGNTTQRRATRRNCRGPGRRYKLYLNMDGLMLIARGGEGGWGGRGVGGTPTTSSPSRAPTTGAGPNTHHVAPTRTHLPASQGLQGDTPPGPHCPAAHVAPCTECARPRSSASTSSTPPGTRSRCGRDKQTAKEDLARPPTTRPAAEPMGCHGAAALW